MRFDPYRCQRWIRAHRAVYLGGICAVVLIFAIVLLFLFTSALPAARTVHEKCVRADLSSRVYQTVRSAVENFEEKAYTRTVYDQGGYISQISVDTASINRLCNSVVFDLNESFSKAAYTDIRIPLGSALGMDLFTGKGARIRIRSDVYPVFTAKVSSEFTEAGINQTMHELTLTVSCDVVSVCAGQTVEFSESYVFSLQKSIIVGSVPFS